MDSIRAIWSGGGVGMGMLVLAIALLGASPARAQEGTVPPAAADSSAAARRGLTCSDGEKDAKAAPAPWGYQVGGLLTGPLGLGFAMMHTPRPSPSRLEFAGVGAEEYSRCYGSTAKKANVKAAANGFAIGVIAAAIVIFYEDSRTAP